MAQPRWKPTPGWKISPGKISGIENLRHLLSLPKRITSTRRISMRTGKTRRMNNSSWTWWILGETRFRLSSTATISISNWQLSAKIQHLSTPLRFYTHKKEVKLHSQGPWFSIQGPSAQHQKITNRLRSKHLHLHRAKHRKHSIIEKLQDPLQPSHPSNKCSYSSNYSNYNSKS